MNVRAPFARRRVVTAPRVVLSWAIVAASAVGAPLARAEPASGAATTGGATGGERKLQVAVARLEFSDSVVDAARELFARRLLEGATSARLDVVAGRELAQKLGRADGTSPPICREPACYIRIARALGVSWVIGARVNEANKTYDIDLDLISGRSGAVVGSSHERCEICGVEEAAEKMAIAASSLKGRLDALMKEPSRLVIQTRPPGITVLLDGERVGRTPLDAEMSGGPHRLELRADGYVPAERLVTTVSGVDQRLEVDMVPLPTRFPLRALGIVASLTGIAAVVAGLWVLSVDGSEVACTETERGDVGQCPRVRDMRVLSASLVGAGAISATLGGVWLYMARTPGAPAESSGASAPATSIGVAGRF